MRPRQVFLLLLICTCAGCTHECRVESDVPRNAQQSKALKDAQARVDAYCKSANSKCRYRIAQDNDGPIIIHADFLYDEPGGSGCGGDLYQVWKFSAAGDLVED